MTQSKSPHGLIVAGSRDLDNSHYHYVKHAIETWARMWCKPDLIIHGDCPTGADQLAAHWAACREIRVEAYPVTTEEWRSIGPSAGPRRNGRMVALPYARGLAVVRFIDSVGSADVFRQATRKGLPTIDVVVPR